MTAQEAQLKAQQQQNPAALMMHQRMGMKNSTILCLNTFAEHLSNFRVCQVPNQGKSLERSDINC